MIYYIVVSSQEYIMIDIDDALKHKWRNQGDDEDQTIFFYMMVCESKQEKITFSSAIMLLSINGKIRVMMKLIQSSLI